MEKQAAVKLIRETFERPFDKARFVNLCQNLVKHLDTSKNFSYQGNIIPDAYDTSIQSYERIGKYEDPEGKRIDILIVRLRKGHSLEHARTKQRNFVAWYLQHRAEKDAALVAFVSPGREDWRFSLVRMDYNMVEPPGGKVKVETGLTPARRYSFLVGGNESSHTAQGQLLPILQDDERQPLLSDFEKAFNIEVVTREFFTRYRDLFNEVREALEIVVQQNLKVRENFETNRVDTVNFAKKLLGQIVFLYFLQKKGWFGVPSDRNWGDGEKNFLRNLFDKAIAQGRNFFNCYLEYLFYEALARQDRGTVDPAYYPRFNCKIPFLNGGLFDPINGYDWVHTDIILPDMLFSNNEKTKEGDTGTGILDVFDRFNFTVKEDEPLEKEVAVDPEMLGKVFENLLEVRDRKSRGTYYTPREIVHYMCQESLISYLDTAINSGEVPLAREKPVNLKLFGSPATQQMALKTEGYTGRVPREDIEAFIRLGELAIEHDARVESEGRETRDYSYRLPPSIRLNAALIDDRLAGIRACDPAVGSGAFLVGLMTEIVRARNTLTTYLPGKESRTSYSFKRHAIQSCLYGVDIDPGAVEIAKLRLWLSLVVDEEDFKQIQPLPNLDYKIIRGNSLLRCEQDVIYWPLFDELEKLKTAYFEETSGTKKGDLKKKINALLNKIEGNSREFNFTVDFSEVFPKQDTEKWGFDIVIANPPYVRQEQIRELKPGLQKGFTCYSGAADIYVYFYERGRQILKKNCTLTYISSNKYFRAGYGEKLRRFLGSNCQICQLIDFGDAPVFEAIAYPSIILLRNAPPQENRVQVFTWKPGPPVEEFAPAFQSGSFLIAQRELTPDGWRLESPAVLRLLEKLRRAGKPLREYVKGRFYYGIKSGLNEAFVVDRATRDRLIAEHPSSAEVLKPFLRGRDVKRWRVEPQDLWLIFTRHGVDIKKYPAIHRYLSQYKKQLMPGVEGGRKPGSYKWYEIQDNIAYWQEFERPKIIYPDIAPDSEFAYDGRGYYLGNTLYLLPTDKLWLLGVLNSKTVFWFYTKISTQIRGGFVRFIAQYVSQIPIPEPREPARIEAAVKRILDIKGKDPDADVSALERQIDQMVYELYGLTGEEIGVVEGEK